MLKQTAIQKKKKKNVVLYSSVTKSHNNKLRRHEFVYPRGVAAYTFTTLNNGTLVM
jgi:hypothetical protein